MSGDRVGRAPLDNDDNGRAPPAQSPTPKGWGTRLMALLHDLQPHGELDLRTLAYHLQQSDATAADGYCHAAINEARSALEALVFGIVQGIGGEDVRRAGISGRTPFSNWRRFLVDAGFLDAHESDILHFIYSLSSAKGSHHGVTDKTWTRLAQRIVFAAGQYLVERYAAWKCNGRSFTPPSRRRQWLPRVFGALLGK